MSSIKVSLVQQQMQADYQANLDFNLAAIHAAAENNAALVVLCELHTSLYFCQEQSPRYFDLAQTIPSTLTKSLGQAAKENEVVIIGSLFEECADGLYYNTAVVFESDGSLAGIYRKMHIPDDPGYHENYYFTPGDLGFNPIRTSIGKLGVMICWDQWFPEGARLMAIAGAQVLIYPTAIGWDIRDNDKEKQRQLRAWKIIQQSHAIANNLPLICVNRVGHEKDLSGNTKGIDFWGQSFTTDTLGKITSQASASNAETLYATINLSETEQTRKIWPYLRNRRVDAYKNIDKRFIGGKI